MPPRARRFVAAIGVLVFLAFWIWGTIALSDALPDHWLVDMVLFIVAGTFWGIPLIPLIRWAEKPVAGHVSNDPKDPN